MINANELRTGNIVNFMEDDTVFTVTEISNTGIGVRNHFEETWIELDQFSPIQITPDVLESCGFIKPDGLFRMDIKYVGEQFPCYLIYLEHTKQIEVCRSGIYAISVPCESLHQLQNLYFALTGHDLPITNLNANE